ncbi:MAG TPA: glycosyltransferase family 2 protein [Patescibacteria group bacterium]|jgi:glycosyltransferase involved in cell wall biosynthesis|nr:glycosyltransferase family 2 protein [Patescibacteria group bacterium]
MRKVSQLSVFFPFWNEQENIESVIKKATAVLEKVADKWEIIMVDDGSADKTLEIAKELVKQSPRLSVVSHVKNRGYGAALKSGFAAAKYDLVVFNDGDGQFDFSEITKFLERVENADMVIGYRKKRLDNPFRHILMNMLKVWDLVLFGFKFKDIDCGFKLFKKEALDKIQPLKSEGAMITTEILARAKKVHLKIAQVEVNHYPRIYGNQSGGNLRVILRAVKESLWLWKDLNFNYGRS